MKILNKNETERTGFAGIRENRIVTDSRLFGKRKKDESSEGYGQLVYIADANYEPQGESGMHSHEEIDIITIILEGRVSHEGSLEHGRNLEAGDVQVQRAGEEGLAHNEMNPDKDNNRILQVWALPEKSGERASYKYYKPGNGVTKIYGGNTDQNDTFSSSTTIEMLNLKEGEEFTLDDEAMAYIAEGDVQVSSNSSKEEYAEGDLSMIANSKLVAKNDLKMVIIRK